MKLCTHMEDAFKDERKTIFARMALKPGTKEFADFYSREPELFEIDEKLRRQKSAISFGGQFAADSKEKTIVSSINDGILTIKDFIARDKNEPISSNRVQISPESFGPHLFEALKLWGASSVGFTKVDESDLYLFSRTGKKKGAFLPNAIVFAIEMSADYINRAPHAETMLATVEAYIKAAYVGMRLSLHLKSLGYKTELNTVFGYSAPLVPLAQKAGIGQIGFNNLLVNRQFGARLRLGAVFTDAAILPLPVDFFNLHGFCNECRLCIQNCPGKALKAFVPEENIPGVCGEKCYQVWLNVKTDCGVCISSCPFSQKLSNEELNMATGSQENAREFLTDFKKRYGKRNYRKQPLTIVNID